MDERAVRRSGAVRRRERAVVGLSSRISGSQCSDGSGGGTAGWCAVPEDDSCVLPARGSVDNDEWGGGGGGGGGGDARLALCALLWGMLLLDGLAALAREGLGGGGGGGEEEDKSKGGPGGNG